LRELHNKNVDWLKKYNDTISDTWLVDNNMILRASFSTRVLEGITELNIFISEKRNDYAIRPFCIDIER
jgi:hypothetical protein